MAFASHVLMLLSLLVASCLEESSAVELPASNDMTIYREDKQRFFAVWDAPELLDGTMPNMSKVGDVSFHDPDLDLGGLGALRDLVYPIQAEREFQGTPWGVLFRRFWWLACLTSFVYLLSVWLGTNYMQSRPAYDLKKPLAIWNLLLAVFSIFGMVRTVPHLALLLHSYGFEYTLCRAAASSYGNGAAGLWMLAFVLSKYAELIDTVFLVLRKKPVNFLHWYHHSTVLMYCWHGCIFQMPTGIFFAAMNYSVHSVMYLYYFLAAVLPKPPRWATGVTILQLAQMAGGIFVTVRHMQVLLHGTVSNCDGYITNLAGALIMYASYFMLFAQFFAKRYCSKRSATGKVARKGGLSGAKSD